VRKWLKRLAVVATVLILAAFGAGELFKRFVPVSFGYCVEADFESMPKDDRELRSWLQEQPGVVGDHVFVCRVGPESKTLRMMFTRVHTLGEPKVDLESAYVRFGYTGASPLRDNHSDCGCTRGE
jgi:hypothetical protein